MSTEQNKAAARKFYELFNARDLDGLKEIVASDMVDYQPIPGQPAGLEGLQYAFRVFLQGFPDMQVTIEEQVAEGDKVVQRSTAHGTNTGAMMGIPPTGKTVEITATDEYQFEDGKIVAGWHVEDLLGMMQQIGVIPTGG